MKKTLLLSTLALSLSFNAASTQAAPKDTLTLDTSIPAVESVPSYYGVGTGAVIGTLIGGPIGLVLGSAFGGMIVDEVNTDKQIEALQALNAQHQHLIATQQTELAQLSQRFQYSEQTNEQNPSFEQVSHHQPHAVVNSIIPEMLTHIQFATGASTISPIYQPQLDLLIDLLATHDNWLVTLTGYADMRGDNAFNYDLSRSRAEMVEHYLKQGLQSRLDDKAIEPNIIVKGAGEANDALTSSDSLNSVDVEQLMFDRRVAIDIRPVSDVQVAQQ